MKCSKSAPLEHITLTRKPTSTMSMPNYATQKSLDVTPIVDSMMKGRFSCRYYLQKPVDKSLIDEVIDVARFAPSGNNTQ